MGTIKENYNLLFTMVPHLYMPVSDNFLEYDLDIWALF